MNPAANKFVRSADPALAIPHGLSLLPYQKEGVQAMLSFLAANETNSVYNASEQGTGKTIMTAAVLNIMKLRRVLVIGPAVMSLVWEDELKKWSTVPRITHTVLSSTQTGAVEKCAYADLVIMSYNMISHGLVWNKKKTRKVIKDGILKELLRNPFDAIVCDEFHYCKDRKSQRTQIVLGKLWPNARYHIALSGTPFTTAVVDGFTAFNAMLPSKFPSFWDFARDYSYITKHRFGHTFYGIKRPKRLRKILRRNFYIRYLKKDVLLDLPDKTFQRISLPESYSVSAPDRAYEEQLKLDAQIVRKAIEDDKTPYIPPSLAEHRKEQGLKKLPPVIEFIRDKLEEGLPLIVFAWHKDCIARLREAFKEYEPAVITGATPMKLRKLEIKRFQGGDTDLFLGNMKAGGIGVTLTRSSNVILAEVDWSPSTVSQATDRVHRIGQLDPVTIYYFVVRNSIDEVISSTVMNRARVFSKVLDKVA